MQFALSSTCGPSGAANAFSFNALHQRIASGRSTPNLALLNRPGLIRRLLGADQRALRCHPLPRAIGLYPPIYNRFAILVRFPFLSPRSVKAPHATDPIPLTPTAT